MLKKPVKETPKQEESGAPRYTKASPTLLGEQAAAIDTSKQDTALPHWLTKQEWLVIRGR